MIGSGGEPQLEASILTMAIEPVRSEIEVRSTLTDSGGAPLSGRTITLLLNERAVMTGTSATDGSVVFRLPRSDVSPGDLVSVTFAGDSTYEASSAQTTYHPAVAP